MTIQRKQENATQHITDDNSINSRYIKTALDIDGDELITSHYINEVLPNTKQFEQFHCNRLSAWAKGVCCEPLKSVFARSKELNERQVEDALIRPILECLGNKLIAQVPLSGDTMDFCTYIGNNYAFDYTNTGAIIESKRYGRIEQKYYVRKKDNSDEIYQSLNYLRTVNLTLNNSSSSHNVNFIVLSDGYRFRIYSKAYTHNISEFERHFIEFDLEKIANIEDDAMRDKYLKIFGIFLCKESLCGKLLDHEKASSELEMGVSKGLREQTFMALEYIATGLWRKLYIDASPLLSAVLQSNYGINLESAKTDEDTKAKLLKLVYDESLVFLLRTLFVLYAEDRNLFDQSKIPKVIKGQGNLLDLIVQSCSDIGEINDTSRFQRNDDLKLAKTFTAIDNTYNGGLFSAQKHPLLYELDIDDVLFAQAIDNLCRVNIKKKVYTIDFSAVSVRELGSIYESLLEYKLAIVTEDVPQMPSIINKQRIRRNIKKGDLYLINHDGQRKTTGSYYTPDLIVEHLVKTALDPKLEKIKKEHGDNIEDIISAVFDLKICDPSMGSGHMVQAAYTRLVQFLHQCIEEASHDGKTKRTWDESYAYYIRTSIARKCIYGVDLNPIAVDLAKLVMWMKIFRPDKPFEFFDYNLACGNSLVGIYDESSNTDDDAVQIELFRTREQIEADILSELLLRVKHMQEMPRNTVDEVHEVEHYWKNEVRSLQAQVAFFYNVKLAKWLLPESKKLVETNYQELIENIDKDPHFVARIIAKDPSLPEGVLSLGKVAQEIKKRYNPLHWKIAFPHVSVNGGFDCILANPPWDKVKAYRGDFFSDYIDDYANMQTKDAKAASNALMQNNERIKQKWEEYESSFLLQTSYYQDAYHYQVVYDEHGKALKGDANLYKVFIEKIYTILKKGGSCGIVVPDNLNIDKGCTGLRRLLLNEASIKELIMFENRKKLFEIHGQYKFNVLSFEKVSPRKNASFDTGFYWYDPIWLDGSPDADYIALDKKNQKIYHKRYSYPTSFIRKMFPDKLTILEFKDKKHLDILEKMTAYPIISDDSQNFYISTYREFDMTNDSDLFRFDGVGWPLFQGGMIHHFNAHFKEAEKFITQAEGEERLAKKWKKELRDLPDRKYRIAWRGIAQPTDTRSLICTILPRGVFTGNSLNLLEVHTQHSDNSECGATITGPEIISGINMLLSSFCADFYVRQRMAKHVSAFILKELPCPRDLQVIKDLGKMALCLYIGEDFEAFRGSAAPLDDESERQKLIAKLDARVAHFYGFSYEEYQAILETFPLVDTEQKKRCLRSYNDWSFEL